MLSVFYHIKKKAIWITENHLGIFRLYRWQWKLWSHLDREQRGKLSVAELIEKKENALGPEKEQLETQAESGKEWVVRWREEGQESHLRVRSCREAKNEKD